MIISKCLVLNCISFALLAAGAICSAQNVPAGNTVSNINVTGTCEFVANSPMTYYQVDNTNPPSSIVINSSTVSHGKLTNLDTVNRFVALPAWSIIYYYHMPGSVLWNQSPTVYKSDVTHQVAPHGILTTDISVDYPRYCGVGDYRFRGETDFEEPKTGADWVPEAVVDVTVAPYA